MSGSELFVLNLRAPLLFRAPAQDLRSPSMTEGEEELLVFDSVLLFGPDDDEGPRIASLPRPEFEGSSKGRGEEYELPAGRYAFMQARPADEAELLSFLEAFARDAWWEGIKLEGPFFLRRLREDGRTAVQYLRRCSD